MASENIKDHEVLDLLDLSDSEVEEWIPDTDEEWDATDEDDDPEPNHQERSDTYAETNAAWIEDNRIRKAPPQQCDFKLFSPHQFSASMAGSSSNLRQKGPCMFDAISLTIVPVDRRAVGVYSERVCVCIASPQVLGPCVRPGRLWRSSNP
ncbi:hypothetical protein PoB_002114300 [Plakobranchus ocellatus]|uniref:Uncharacterized protein n=1 Tax=Plakobranchus ocellatus TaxID=259542 RepID=A0AAV3ZIJ9_9GAST|nr:hypothetical protein PoB_002114300 [Plakobranchus ocellatus]